MNDKKITASQIRKFEIMLKQEERSAGIVEKYLRDVRAYGLWLDSNPVSTEQTMHWKSYLLENEYATVTINSMLFSLKRKNPRDFITAGTL